MWRSVAIGAACAAGSCGYASGPTSWCDDGPSDFVIAAGMEQQADGTLLIASAWGETDEGQCRYVRRAGAVHSIPTNGDASVSDLPDEPGLELAAGDSMALLSSGEWFAGGIGGGVQHSPGADPAVYSVSLAGLDVSEEEPPAGLGRQLISAGGRVFLLTGATLHRHDGGDDFVPVLLPSDVLAAAGTAGSLFAVLESGEVAAIDPVALSVSATYEGCVAPSIAPFGAGKLALACAQGIGVVSTAPPSFAVLSTEGRFVQVWGDPLAEAVLVTTTGGLTRVFTLASGAQGELAGGVFDAELTGDAAYAVLIEAQYTPPFFLDDALVRVPYDGGPPVPLLESWGPMQVEWAGSGDLVVGSGRLVLHLDPATGLETGRQELEPPPSFYPPFPL